MARNIIILFSLLLHQSSGEFSLPQFPDGSVWQLDISDSDDIHPNSSAITQWLEDQGGFGNSRFQIDFSIVVLHVNCSTDTLNATFIPKSGYYSACDSDINSILIPKYGSLEGTANWTHAQSCGGDCHLIVMNELNGLLYESWDTSITFPDDDVTKDPIIEATCLVAWNVSHDYPSDGRGDGCTSADAAGFPIATLLFTPYEIHVKQEIDHAIRFILPNARCVYLLIYSLYAVYCTLSYSYHFCDNHKKREYPCAKKKKESLFCGVDLMHGYMVIVRVQDAGRILHASSITLWWSIKYIRLCTNLWHALEIERII